MRPKGRLSLKWFQLAPDQKESVNHYSAFHPEPQGPPTHLMVNKTRVHYPHQAQTHRPTSVKPDSISPAV